jgi:hypothetical protein
MMEMMRNCSTAQKHRNRTWRARQVDRIIIGGVMLAFWAAANPAWAVDEKTNVTAYVNGDSLLQKCQADHLSLRGECIGYIKGVSDVRDDAPPQSRNVCAPPVVTAGQLRDIVVMFLRGNPNRRNYSGAAMIDVALRNAFPCKRGS